MAIHWSKVAFFLPPFVLGASIRVSPLVFTKLFGVRKLPKAILGIGCVNYSTVLIELRFVTDEHRAIAYNAQYGGIQWSLIYSVRTRSSSETVFWVKTQNLHYDTAFAIEAQNFQYETRFPVRTTFQLRNEICSKHRYRPTQPILTALEVAI